jgi:CRP/FNR family cyclic AMP-dependent transcriptional regulator
MGTAKGDSGRIEMLARVPVFAPLGDKILARIAKDAKEKSFATGDKLVSRGENGVGFYLLLEGKVEVRANGKVLATLGPAQFFGEMALLDDQPRSADVVAVSGGRCLVISRWEFWGPLSNEPEAIRILFQETVRRLRAQGPGFSE